MKILTPLSKTKLEALLDQTLLSISAFVMFVMMALTFIDVLGRYIFAAPLPGAFEMIQFLMPFLIFSVLPILTKEDSHIMVTVLDSILSPRVRWIQALFVQTASGVAVGFICWCLWEQGQKLNEGLYISGYLGWPIGPVAYAMAALCFITLLVQIVKLWHHLKSYD
jgi:TRAP-type C4-dicarboxylate transport system permease small subunit